jgi:hypothetical protein
MAAQMPRVIALERLYVLLLAKQQKLMHTAIKPPQYVDMHPGKQIPDPWL